MAAKSLGNRLSNVKHSVTAFVAVQQQRLVDYVQPTPRQENLNTSNVVKILVIGETGSGKSTFINYLTNYFRKGTLENLKVAIPSTFHPNVTENFEHHEHDMNDKTQSKTDSCNQYMFTDGKVQYLFIDTPGLSDTRGAEQDKANLTKIIDAVENLAGLTAVIIVVNGAVARLTVNLRNVITQLRGNLPDVVMDNVIVVLTNTSRHTANFSLTALELNGNVYPYYMQNSAFSTDPTRWTPGAMQSLQRDWNQAMSELEAMTKMLNTFKTKSVAAFKNMKDIRNAIKALMHAARVEVVQIQKMQDEIAMFEVGLKQAQEESVTYKDYTKERIVDKVELVDAPYHSTLCQNCNNVCHDNCGLDETTYTGAQIFQQCWAMENGNCKQCQHKCSYTAHYHAKKTVQVTKQTLKDVLADIKSRYDAASQNAGEFKSKITNTADAKKLLEKALQQKNAEIIAKCKELRQICSGFNLAAELHALIDQLEIEARMLRNVDARKQAEEFIRSLKEFCATIEKDQDLVKEKYNQKSTMNIISTERDVDGQAPYEAADTLHGSDQNRLLPVPNAGSGNSASYANDEFMNQIRTTIVASSKKKKKKDQKKKVPESDEESADEDEDKEEDDKGDDSDSERSPPPPPVVNSKSKKKKSVKAKPDAEEFKKLSTTELIARHKACEDQHTANFIIHELKQRSLGKSMPPLNDPAEIARFTICTQKYASLDNNSLKYTYDQLKEQICAITEPDVLQIEKVPPALLYDIAAVNVLLTNASSSSNLGVGNPSLPVQTQVPPFYQPQQQMYPHLPYSQQHHTSFNPHLAYHQQRPYQPNYPTGGAPYSPVDPYHSMHQSLGHPHATLNSPYGRESIPNVPHQYDSRYHMQAGGPADQYRQSPMQAGGPTDQYRQTPLHMGNEHLRRPEIGSPIHYSDLNPNARPPSSQDHQQHVLQNTASPHSTLPASTAFPTSHLPNAFDQLRVNSPFKPIEKPPGVPDVNPPSSRSSSGFSELNSRANSVAALPFELSVDELRNYTDSQLLSAHSDAAARRNRSQEYAIYSELQRRCFGDHPLLIHQEKALFDSKCNFFQNYSLDELKQHQDSIRYKISSYLENNDAININNIPSELIIEAAALDRLVKMKSV